MTRDLVKASKFLSLVLRHKPEKIGLVLDAQGWADIGELIDKAGANGMALTRELIAEVVATSDKQRFALDATGQRIRANQGHSIDRRPGARAQGAAGHAISRHGREIARRHPRRGAETGPPPARASVP